MVKPNYLNVLPSPAPDIRPSTRVICNGPGGSVSFTDSTPNVVSREWVIDGYKYLNNQTVNHNFSGIGNKSVTLKVKNSYGCQGIFSKNDYIKIFDPVDVDFCSSTVTDKSNHTVDFYPVLNTYGQTVTSYKWDFPGGTPNSSTKMKPQVVYPNNSKTFDVTLTVTTATGCVYTNTRKNYIKNFIQIKNDSFCFNEVFKVTSLATGDGRGFFNWDFNGGSLVPFTNFDVSFKTGTPGWKDFDLSYAFSKDGCRHKVRFKEIVFIKPPRASFASANPNQCVMPANVKLSSNSLLPGFGRTLYTWHIFDTLGNELSTSPKGPSTNPDATFQFSQEGFYDAQLIVSSTNGCTDTAYKDQYIRIGAPVADFKSEDSVICARSYVKILDETKPPAPASNPYIYKWKIWHKDSPNVTFQYGDKEPSFYTKIQGSITYNW